MAQNVVYITAKFDFTGKNFDQHKFVCVRIPHPKANEPEGFQYMMYLGNLSNPEGILRQFKDNGYIQAVCRLRWVYEHGNLNVRHQAFFNLSDFWLNSKIKNKLIFLEVIKVTQLPEAKLYPPECKGFVKYTDSHARLFQLIKYESKKLTDENKSWQVSLIGNLDKHHSFSIYKVTEIDKTK